MNGPLGNNYSLLDIMAPFALSHIHQRRPRFLHVQMIFGRAFGSSVPCHKDKLINPVHSIFGSFQILLILFLAVELYLGELHFDHTPRNRYLHLVS